MGKTFQYHETLEDTSLSEMFATIYRHKVPGLIEISRDDVSKRIYINEGNVVHATSTDRTDRLGAHLYRQGKLSRKQLVETMRRRELSGKRHGQLLIEDQLLSPGELYEAIRTQMESIVWSVFSWQRGEVTFRIGEYNEPIMIKIHLPMRQVIVRGIKQVPDTKALVAQLGRKNTIFKPTYGTEDLIEIALDRKEYQLLCLVDGKRQLFDICSAGPYSISENARLLYAFNILKLITKVEDNSKSSKSPKGSVMIRM
ncbi:MAG: DUF4388 domain-containing protein [Acidobacteriota bacterium]